jgi:hypothetical protein
VFPILFEMLAEGSVHLTTVRLLAPHLTPQNHRDVLHAARGKPKAAVQEIVARLSPRPDVAASVRRLPAPALVAPSSPSPLLGTGPLPFHAPAQPAAMPAAMPAAVFPAAPTPRPTSTPLSPDRYRLQLTIGGDTLEKLRLARDMLGHALPSGDCAAVIDRALTLLLVELSKAKFADTPHPRPSRGTKRGSRTVSAAVRRAVWVRDLGRCAFVAATGHRCNETRTIEFHHVDPYALGGEGSVDQIQLRCRRHDDYEGRLYFGRHRAPAELVPEQVRLSPQHSGHSPPTD